MKIFIPFQLTGIGGSRTFVKKFSSALERDRHVVSHTLPTDFDVLFIIADCKLLYLLVAKWRHKKIIQRLDGVNNFATTQSRFYWIYNLKMFFIYHFFADEVIFQSNFSKKSCDRFLGKVKVPYTIIYNGVDLNEFSPDPSANPETPTRCITYAKFRREDQIVPLIEAIKMLPQDTYTFDIFGEYIPSLAQHFQNLPPNIHFQGSLENRLLAKQIPSYSLFLFSDQSACPNSVLEALACGLPVVAYNRGSISEIITPSRNGEMVSLKEHDPFQDPFPFGSDSYKKMASCIQKITPRLSAYKIQARATAQAQFDLEQMLVNYKNIF